MIFSSSHAGGWNIVIFSSSHAGGRNIVIFSSSHAGGRNIYSDSLAVHMQEDEK